MIQTVMRQHFHYVLVQSHRTATDSRVISFCATPLDSLAWCNDHLAQT